VWQMLSDRGLDPSKGKDVVFFMEAQAVSELTKPWGFAPRWVNGLRR
jgi:hypothetical protein